MRYEKTLKISKKELDHINHLLHTEPLCKAECFCEDAKISYTVQFHDGIEMDIQLCGVQYKEDESNLPWTQAVLYQNGTELTFTEAESEYEGTWICYYGKTDDSKEDDEYVVMVVVEEEN